MQDNKHVESDGTLRQIVSDHDSGLCFILGTKGATQLTIYMENQMVLKQCFVSANGMQKLAEAFSAAAGSVA